MAARRAAVMETGLRLFRPLSRYVEREVGRVITASGTPPALTLRELMASIYLSARLEVDDDGARGAVFPWFRRIARQEVGGGAPVPATGVVGGASTPVRVAALLELLPAAWREIFVLNARDGWSAACIAERRGMDVAEVQAVVLRAWAFLGEWLREDAA